MVYRYFFSSSSYFFFFLFFLFFLFFFFFFFFFRGLTLYWRYPEEGLLVRPKYRETTSRFSLCCFVINDYILLGMSSRHGSMLNKRYITLPRINCDPLPRKWYFERVCRIWVYRLVGTGKGELKILQDPTHVRHTCPNKELEKKVSLNAQLRYSAEIRQAKSTEAPIWTGA